MALTISRMSAEIFLPVDFGGGSNGRIKPYCASLMSVLYALRVGSLILAPPCEF